MSFSHLPILLVEDEAIVAMVISMALEEAGFEVEQVYSGMRAVDALTSNAAAYQALVTDIRLPEVDGWDIARRARVLNPQIPVVYMSGDSCAEWQRQGVGNSLMLQKPFGNGELLAAIGSLIGWSLISPAA